MHRLWINGSSPYARLCRVVALEKGVMLELQWTDPWRDPADLLDAAPPGKIPALELTSGERLVESSVICEMLERLGGGGPMLGAPADAAGLARLGLARALMDNAFGAVAQRRFDPDGAAPGLATRWRAGLLRTLTRLEETAPPPDGAFDLAAATLGVALAYLELRYPDVVLAPRLAAFYAAVSRRDSFTATVWATG